jgi:prepilin peptidase CpaA
MSLEVGIAVLVGAAAIVEDLRRRTISDWIPLVALSGGITCQVLAKGWWGLPAAALGAASGFGVFLVFYLLGGMGGGDIKLMAGFGALLGASRLLQAALWTAIIGALLAVVVLAVSWLRTRIRGPKTAEEPRTIPYAPAIAMGVWIALIPT